jgi:hypothetical protein
MARKRRPAPAAAADAPFKGDESGHMAWKLFPRSKRECRECGCALRIVDVGEHRRLYPGAVDEFLCRTCQRAHTELMIEENRHALGLQKPWPRA